MFGVWAVHRAVPTDRDLIDGKDIDPTAWSVSHLPTGRSVSPFLVEPDFWMAMRVARALDDTGIFLDEDLSSAEDVQIFMSAIGAAMNDHYVFPIYTLSDT